MIFLSQKKNLTKSFILNRQPPKLPLLKFLAKFLTGRKSQNEQLYYCEANISLEKVTKSINSQTYNKSPGNYGLHLFK